MKEIFGSGKEVFIKKVIFVDGISRSGKFFLGKLLGGLENTEYFQHVSVLEHLPYIHRLGGISESAAISLLRVNVDEHTYNLRIGRNINFRCDDASSLHNSLEGQRYLKKSSMPMSAELTKEAVAETRIPVFILHECLPNIKIFFKAFADLKWVELIRHPVDVIHSWFLRGWGRRFTSDPLSFVPVARGVKIPVPWFAYEWSEEFESMSEIDRIIKSIFCVTEMGQEAYRFLAAEQKKQTIFVTYEDLVQKSEESLESLAAFLNAPPCAGLSKILSREKCPREIPPQQREQKIKDIKEIASKEMFALMMESGQRYEKKY